MEVILAIVWVLAGYALAILTWPHVRTFVLGVRTEIDELRARARALEVKLNMQPPRNDNGKR